MGRVSLRTKARAGGAVPTSGCWIRRLNGLRESNFYGFHYCLFWPNSWLHPPKFLIIFVAWSLTTDNEVWSPIAMYEPVTSHLSLPWKGNEIGIPILFQEIWGCFDYIRIYQDSLERITFLPAVLRVSRWPECRDLTSGCKSHVQSFVHQEKIIHGDMFHVWLLEGISFFYSEWWFIMIYPHLIL